MQPETIKPTPEHYSENPRPVPSGTNTAWPWNVSPHTHYIKMPNGRLMYVRRIVKADIDALETQADLCAVAVYAANALAIAHHEGLRSCLKFVMAHASRRIGQLYNADGAAPATREREAA